MTKVLVVEDEALTAQLVVRYLKRRGYEVCKPVATGEEAIRVASSDAPDCILIDIHLAGEISGIEAASEIIAQRDVPIAFMTGYPDQIFDQLRNSGFGVCLRKPLALNEIDEFLESTFGHPSTPPA